MAEFPKGYFYEPTIVHQAAKDSFLMKNEDDFTEGDRLKFQALKWTLDRAPRALRREVFMRIPSAYEMIACYVSALNRWSRRHIRHRTTGCLRAKRHPEGGTPVTTVRGPDPGACNPSL